MSATDSKAIVDKFFDAWTSGDFKTVRSLVHDDVSYSDPIDQFDTHDAYIGSLQRFSQVMKAAEVQHVFVDGTDVCVIYDLVTNTPIPPSPTAEWFHLRDGKISDMRVIFDARPFAAMSEKR